MENRDQIDTFVDLMSDVESFEERITDRTQLFIETLYGFIRNQNDGTHTSEYVMAVVDDFLDRIGSAYEEHLAFATALDS